MPILFLLLLMLGMFFVLVVITRLAMRKGRPTKLNDDIGSNWWLFHNSAGGMDNPTVIHNNTHFDSGPGIHTSHDIGSVSPSCDCTPSCDCSSSSSTDCGCN